MQQDDVRYCRHRAETEVEHARGAMVPEVARVHYQLAEAFSEIASAEPARIEVS